MQYRKKQLTKVDFYCQGNLFMQCMCFLKVNNLYFLPASASFGSYKGTCSIHLACYYIAEKSMFDLSLTSPSPTHL